MAAPRDDAVDLDAPLRIGVDVDGVLFDQNTHVRQQFREIHGIEVGPVESWPADLTEHPPISEAGLDEDDTWEVFHAVHNDPELHRTEPLDADAVRVMGRLLEDDHRVDVVTARSAESREVTRTFLQRNDIPHDKLVMGAQDKSGWDVLVDDLPVHVARAAEDGALALLMDQPYNRAFEADGNPRRVASWADVAGVLDIELP